MARRAARRPRDTGSVRQLPSGRWQARCRDDDGALRPAPQTFDTKLDASTWLADYADGSAALEPAERRVVPTFREYAEAWLASGGRRGQLKPRTRDLYRSHLDAFILPTFGALKLDRISPTRVRAWYGTLDAGKPTQRRQVYGLLSSIMATAYRDRIINEQPCTVDGAHKLDRKGTTRVASLEEVETIADTIAPRYRAAVLLAVWCSLRQGELLELRRRDVDLATGQVSISRAVTRTSDGPVVGLPKSDAGIRTVSIPPHVLPDVKRHLTRYVEADQDALLFPARLGGWLQPSSLYRVFYRAREAAGRPDLRWHDLRHTGATLAAQSGATVADVMRRVGHSTTRAAMIYQHASDTRDAEVAAAMSERAAAIVLIESRRRTASGT